MDDLQEKNKILNLLGSINPSILSKWSPSDVPVTKKHGAQPAYWFRGVAEYDG